jgi:hypothetical protein
MYKLMTCFAKQRSGRWVAFAAHARPLPIINCPWNYPTVTCTVRASQDIRFVTGIRQILRDQRTPAMAAADIASTIIQHPILSRTPQHAGGRPSSYRSGDIDDR